MFNPSDVRSIREAGVNDAFPGCETILPWHGRPGRVRAEISSRSGAQRSPVRALNRQLLIVWLPKDSQIPIDSALGTSNEKAALPDKPDGRAECTRGID